MVIDQCPHCGTRHVQTSRQYADHFVANDMSVTWQLVRCQNIACQKMILVEQPLGQEPLVKYPFAVYLLESSIKVPQPLRDDFNEAGICLGAGCYRASLVMSRRALQRILKEQGCTQRDLVDAINHAVSTGQLRKAFHPLADEMRHYGNLSAHPDDNQLGNATRDSAAHILGFARLLIQEFYEVPTAAASLKSQRQPKP